MEHLFDDVLEIEDRLRAESPPVLYKYRDWNCSEHKKIISHNEIWLAHPKSLNDDMDIRLPLKFNYDEIHSSLFSDKLKKYAEQYGWFKSLIPGSKDFFIACEKKLEQIRQNPVQYFKNTHGMVYNSDVYDCIGILSLTQNPISRTMWAHYGSNSTGFCIGFNTVELFKDIMPINFGRIDYIKEPMSWSFLNAETEKISDWFYLKHIDWISESEYRFVTSDIVDNHRVRNFKESTVREILVGVNMPEHSLNELIQEIKQNYPRKVPLYRTVRDANSYEIGKIEISY